MGKKVYIGTGTARRVKRIYWGVGNIARKVKKGYIGVNGKARQFFQSGFDAGWVRVYGGSNTSEHTPVYQYYDKNFTLIKETKLSVKTTKSGMLQYPRHAGVSGALFVRSWVPNYFTSPLSEIDPLTGAIVQAGNPGLGMDSYMAGDGVNIIWDQYTNNISRTWYKISTKTLASIASNTYSGSSTSAIWGGSYNNKFWYYGTYRMTEYSSDNWASIRSLQFPSQSQTGVFDCLDNSIYAAVKNASTGVLYHVDYTTGANRGTVPATGVSAYYNVASIKST